MRKTGRIAVRTHVKSVMRSWAADSFVRDPAFHFGSPYSPIAPRANRLLAQPLFNRIAPTAFRSLFD